MRMAPLFSMEGRLALIVALCCLASVALFAVLLQAFDSWLVASLGCGLALLFLAIFSARLWIRPLLLRLRALESGTASFLDSDFSISLSEQGPPELKPIIQSYNLIGQRLRSERQTLHQRELLLDTVIQASPIAMILVDARGHVIYSNHAARQMLNQGKPLPGLAWQQVLSQIDPAIADALRHHRGGVFTLEGDDGETESCLAVVRQFVLNAQPHDLFLLQRLTRELNRQEVATWKKVIRIISHELNNSVAPITSLVHSGRILAERGDRDRLLDALDRVSERAHHLSDFIGQYARFARLPEPVPSDHHWSRFLEPLAEMHGITVIEPLPETTAWFDATLLEQALINLIKNAREAGSPADQISIRCQRLEHRDLIELSDRGTGIAEKELKQVLAPFYSTKKSGSGIGLALCREIIEAHGGEILLHNRQQGGLCVQMTLPLQQ